LPANIVALSPNTDAEILKHILSMMTDSFTGTRTTAPEATLSWCADDSPGFEGPLRTEPSSERRKFFDFIIQFTAYMALPHGCCFALMKDGKPVAASLCFPPSDKALHNESACDMIKVVSKHGMPSLMTSGKSAVRMEAVSKLMKVNHKKFAHERHWYVQCFAVGAAGQGQGAGRELMEWLTKCADHTGHPMYLETFGARNIRFYQRNGFDVCETCVVDAKSAGKLELEGGGTAMLRKPNSA
jgi:ribosomal protein S18 acetylase RimI-like enzyme